MSRESRGKSLDVWRPNRSLGRPKGQGTSSRTATCSGQRVTGKVSIQSNTNPDHELGGPEGEPDLPDLADVVDQGAHGVRLGVHVDADAGRMPHRPPLLVAGGIAADSTGQLPPNPRPGKRPAPTRRSYLLVRPALQTFTFDGIEFWMGLGANS